MKAATLSILSTISTIPALRHDNAPESSSSIEWKKCDPKILKQLEPEGAFPNPIQCATLPVPLDYTNDESDEQLDLALVRVKATKKPVLGSILINPGGPGASGVEYVAQASGDLLETLGGQFDLIGFDPRGTGKTIPFACESSDDTSMKSRSVNPILVEQNMTDYLFNGGWESSVSYAEDCYKSMKKTGEYISTAFVVRDMVNIIDALGEDGLLRYWGTSYGTLLGATFAAMFPERVERVLLDGVVNPHEYVAGTYFDTLRDADNALLGLLSECVYAPNLCSAAKFLGPRTTATELLNAINEKLQGLLETEDEMGVEIYDKIKGGIFSSLYSPIQWPQLANELTVVLNATSAEALIESFKEANVASKNKREDDEDDDLPYDEGYDSQFGIQCIDTTWRAKSPREIKEIVEEQAALSTFSDYYFPDTWNCPPWKMKAREAYTGNFTAETKYPILFMNGRWDPVTPLSSAFNSSAGFKDSIVLTHNGFGHGVTAHPSLCTGKAIRKYFTQGILPRPGTQCDVDQRAFEYASDGSESLKKRDSTMPDEDMKLLNAMANLGKRFNKRHLGKGLGLGLGL